MVSAQQRGPVSRCSAPDEAARLTFRNELTACLALTAPAGMTEENRRDWLAVAWDTLKHIPPDILTIGARKARLKCDHPSKIVPAIVDETKDMMRWQRERHDQQFTALPAPKEDICTPEEARKILNDLGLKRDWSGETS